MIQFNKIYFFCIMNVCACSDYVESLQTHPESDIAKEIWDAQKISDYTISVTRNCFCPPGPLRAVEVIVKGNQIQSAKTLSDGTQGESISESEYQQWFTIQGMFEYIQEKNEIAEVIEVQYETDHGYPQFVSIDYTIRSTDEGEVFKMFDFLIL